MLEPHSRLLALFASLCSHPSTKPYQNLPPRDDRSQRVDLYSVNVKIQEGRYHSLSEVCEAVEEVWDNGQRLAEDLDLSSMAPLSALNRRIFHKLRLAHGLTTQAQWGSEIVRLRARLSELLESPPAPVRALVQTELLPHRMERPRIPFIDGARYRAFLIAVENLAEEADEMQDLAAELEPAKTAAAIAAGRPLNVAELRPQTFERLEAFARARFRAQGIAYPYQSDDDKNDYL
jgi:hypothetical protein